MVRTLRKSTKTNGLTLGNGGVASYHHAIVLSNSFPNQPYPLEDTIPEVNTDVLNVQFTEQPEGYATIEVRSIPPLLMTLR